MRATAGRRAARVRNGVDQTLEAPVPTVCPDCGPSVETTHVASQYQEETEPAAGRVQHEESTSAKQKRAPGRSMTPRPAVEPPRMAFDDARGQFAPHPIQGGTRGAVLEPRDPSLTSTGQLGFRVQSLFGSIRTTQREYARHQIRLPIEHSMSR